jgi:hypothetical protein
MFANVKENFLICQMKPIVLFLSVTLVAFLLTSLLFRLSSDAEKLDLKVNRFEQTLFAINKDVDEYFLLKLEENFGTFNEVFASQIMQSTNVTDEQYLQDLLGFTKHKDMREAYDSVALLFTDFTAFEQELELAFWQFSDYFPSYPIPEITTFFGGFTYGVVTYDDNIAIGLEYFLGKNSKYYSLLGDPEYLRFQKQEKFIVSNVAEVWLDEYFQKYIGGRDLLSQLIYKGKVMYCIDKMLPESTMEDKFRFSKAQMDWVDENEASIWQHIVHEDLLFSKKEQQFRTFINYAPFAKGMPPEAPGRVGYYIGYRMVSEYMDNNEIDVEELMYLTDSRKFLQQSKYKPTK